MPTTDRWRMTACVPTSFPLPRRAPPASSAAPSAAHSPTLLSTLLLTAALVAMPLLPQRAHAADASATKAKATTHHASTRSRHTRRHGPRHPAPPKTLDRSGKPQRGEASYYGGPFIGKPMADGTPMNPHADIAASKTLPLGTKARVTNLANGRSATVIIRDRGPYVDGRIVDVSPKVAEKLNMKTAGVAPVVVAPIAVPQADGSLKPGSGSVQDFSDHSMENTRTADARQPARVGSAEEAEGSSGSTDSASGTD